MRWSGDVLNLQRPWDWRGTAACACVGAAGCNSAWCICSPMRQPAAVAHAGAAGGCDRAWVCDREGAEGKGGVVLSAFQMSKSVVQNVPRRPVLILCGVLTVVVVVMAYVIALAIAAGCAALALMGFSTTSFAGFIAGSGASVCALIILWSVIPRREKFTPPGPALTRESHPRLFNEIADIAHEFGEPMPDSAYLTFEVNAWVAERGGLFGFGGDRVLAIGLPLLSAMTVAELRAILAHEFAHFYSGDTGFGPFIGKARASLAHCLERLSANYGIIGLLSRWALVALMRLVVIKAFELYWKLFLRLTLMVSRQWEYRADELASAIGGAEPLIRGLRKLSSTEIEWFAFLNSELGPALNCGVRPPVAEGFARFRVVPEIAGMSGAQSARALEEEEADTLSTHPTFKQRAARASSHGNGGLVGDDRLALSLIDDVQPLEEELLQTMLPGLDVTRVRSICWERMTEAAYVPTWYAFAAEYRRVPRAVVALQGERHSRYHVAPERVQQRHSRPTGHAAYARRARRTRRRTRMERLHSGGI